jgi:hypothetical protein
MTLASYFQPERLSQKRLEALLKRCDFAFQPSIQRGQIEGFIALSPMRMAINSQHESFSDILLPLLWCIACSTSRDVQNDSRVACLSLPARPPYSAALVHCELEIDEPLMHIECNFFAQPYSRSTNDHNAGQMCL